MATDLKSTVVTQCVKLGLEAHGCPPGISDIVANKVSAKVQEKQDGKKPEDMQQGGEQASIASGLRDTLHDIIKDTKGGLASLSKAQQGLDRAPEPQFRGKAAGSEPDARPELDSQLDNDRSKRPSPSPNR